MPLDLTAERGRLISARDNIDTTIANIDAELEGPGDPPPPPPPGVWQRGLYLPRAMHATVFHDGYLRVIGGYRPIGVQPFTIYGDTFRSNDLIVAERAMTTGLPPRAFFDAISHPPSGKLIIGPGYDEIDPDRVTNEIYSSADGGATFGLEPIPPWSPRECGAFHYHPADGYTYVFCGLKYTGQQSPRFELSRDAYRTLDFQTWEQRSADLGFYRRSFGVASWHDAIVTLGGFNDNALGGGGESYADAWRSTDGLQTLTYVGNLPFSNRYGIQTTVFNNRLCAISGSRYVYGETQTWPADFWSTDDPDMHFSSWTQHAALPCLGRHHQSIVNMPIDGVPTLALINGYNGAGGTDNCLLKDIVKTTTFNGPWTPLTSSDFWVN